MKHALIALSLLALTGCATTGGGIKVPEKVLVEVQVPCKTEDPVQPQYRYQPPYATTFEGTRDLLGDRELALAYEHELRTALKSCK